MLPKKAVSHLFYQGHTFETFDPIIESVRRINLR